MVIVDLSHKQFFEVYLSHIGDINNDFATVAESPLNNAKELAFYYIAKFYCAKIKGQMAFFKESFILFLLFYFWFC
jgi:hypothetical protein